MLSIYKRGRIFHVRGSVRGQKVRASLDTTSREVAHHRMIELELHGGRKAIRWEKFEEQFFAWKLSLKPRTKKRYQSIALRFSRFLKTCPEVVNDFTPETISRYSAQRGRDIHPTTKKPLGPEGLKFDLRILHSFFSYAVQCGYLETNPVTTRRLNTVPGKTLPFDKEEIARLLAASYVYGDPARWAVVLTFLYTGLRIGDVCALEKRAVNLKAETILLRTTKRDKDVFLGLHPDLRDALGKHLAALSPTQRLSLYVFPTKTGRMTLPESMDGKLRRIFSHAGVKNGHAHRFRDTFAVALLERGASLYDVAKLLGNTARVTEQHYAPYVRELRERAKKLVGQLDFVVIKNQLGHTG